MIIVYRFYYVYDTISIHTLTRSQYLSNGISLFYSSSCDFQISISFMSQKCQNLLPSKINSSQSKGICFVAGGVREKIEAYFPHTSRARERKHQQHNGRSDEGSFSCSKKVSEHYVEFLCGYSLPLLLLVKTLIILLWRQVKKTVHERKINFSCAFIAHDGWFWRSEKCLSTGRIIEGIAFDEIFSLMSLMKFNLILKINFL